MERVKITLTIAPISDHWSTIISIIYVMPEMEIDIHGRISQVLVQHSNHYTTLAEFTQRLTTSEILLCLQSSQRMAAYETCK